MRRPAALLIICSLLAGACATTVGTLTRDAIAPLDGRGPEVVDYVSGLVERARAAHLADQEQWMRLGHWRTRWVRGPSTQADGPNFFMAANGADDPAAELDATLRAFFAPLPSDAPDEVQHPICQFPARFLWLDRELQFDRSKLPAHDCTRFDEFRSVADPVAVSFVFSSYYLNNPASVFGHTFIRLVKRGKASEEKRELLDRAIEFSATVDTQNAFVYGVKGIFGMFPGTFRNVPYYFKVRQYNDFESRDLYEYELSLTQPEIDLLVAHLWELGSTFFDYYYVSENCSYHLLGALEVARPSLELLAHMHWPVIPADTIKALYANPGFVKNVRFRPSLRRTFRARIDDMPAAGRDLVEELAHDPSASLGALDKATSAKVLDAAQDLIDMQFAKQLTYETDSEPARRKQTLLERRAELLIPSDPLEVATPTQSMPQLGHLSRRAGLGYVVDDTGAQSYQLDARLALHDLADPVAGYPELSQLEFLPVRMRYRLDNAGEGDRFTIESASLVRIVSLSPQNPFDRKLSWKADVGMVRIDDEGCDGCYIGRLAIGTGAAFATQSARVIAFATADLHVGSGPGLDGIEGIPIRAGVGPAAGLRLRLTPRLISLTTGELIWLPTQAPTFAWHARSILRYAFGPIFALNLEGYLDERAASGQFSGLVYF